jgi:transposase
MQAMKTVTLDAHTEWSQVAVISPEGEILIELQVETTPEELRRVVSGIPGPKRVVLENGPLSAMIHDALEGLAEQVVSCDPTRNALISRSDSSNDRLDARRLGILDRAGAIHEVYVPPEPYRTLRSLAHYDHMLARTVTRTKNQLKALCRRYGVRYRGAGVYRKAGRREFLEKMPNVSVRWQMRSLYRQLDGFRLERVRAHRMLSKHARKIPVVKKLRKVPGLGPRTAPAVVAWIADPRRFRSASGLSSYAGLGLKNDISNWKVTKRARASKRGNRELKRALFLSARGALNGTNALRARYDARIAAGWEDRKAIRDVARTILFTACSIWKSGKEYDDAKVSVPKTEGGAR